MATIARTKELLRKLALDSYYDEHKEYADNWRNLESKAQGNISVVGIFIAGVFAFLTQANLVLNVYEKFLLMLAIGLLVGSVLFSLLVLKTKVVPVPPLGSFVDYSAKRLLLVEEAEFAERYRRFGNDHFSKWREVIGKMHNAVRIKATCLWIAQVMLMAAILAVAILTVIKVVR